jgi:hypothetical protein
VIQQKTGRVVQFEVTEQTRHSVAAWIAKRALSRQGFLFPSRVRLGEHLSCRQYSRIVKGWIAAVGLPKLGSECTSGDQEIKASAKKCNLTPVLV